MKIALVVTYFPALSETFVLNQITGLIERGHSVDIFADRPGRDACVHADVERYGLRGKTFYAPRLPGNVLARTVQAVRLAIQHGPVAPRQVLGALNVFRFGKLAAPASVTVTMFPVPFTLAASVVHVAAARSFLYSMRYVWAEIVVNFTSISTPLFSTAVMRKGIASMRIWVLHVIGVVCVS